jgi:hypothetical protein
MEHGDEPHDDAKCQTEGVWFPCRLGSNIGRTILHKKDILIHD